MYLNLQDHWYEFSNGHVERVNDEIWETDTEDIVCLWYQSGLESDLIELQEDVPVSFFFRFLRRAGMDCA